MGWHSGGSSGQQVREARGHLQSSAALSASVPHHITAHKPLPCAHLHAGLRHRAAVLLLALPPQRRQRRGAAAAQGGRQARAELLQQWLKVHAGAPPLLQQRLSGGVGSSMGRVSTRARGPAGSPQRPLPAVSLQSTTHKQGVLAVAHCPATPLAPITRALMISAPICSWLRLPARPVPAVRRSLVAAAASVAASVAASSASSSHCHSSAPASAAAVSPAPAAGGVGAAQAVCC